MKMHKLAKLAIVAWRQRRRTRPGNIPVFSVQAKSLPEAWEKAIILAWLGGAQIKTEYDREGDPPSKDCTMLVEIQEPFAEPRIHLGSPSGPEELEIYRLEVVKGIHDNHVGSGGWTYSYHDLLAAYRRWDTVVDQIAFIVEKLTEAPYTRRAQAITWDPFKDPSRQYPPCLQRIWCRLLPGEGGQPVLNMNSHWRSRDGYRADFMNKFVFTDFQRHIAGQLTERLGKTVRVGRYVDISDSYHIYGKDWKEFKAVFALIIKRSFEERTWTTQFAERFFEDARRKLAQEKEGQ